MAKRDDWHKRQKRADAVIYRRLMLAMAKVISVRNDGNLDSAHFAQAQDIVSRIEALSRHYPCEAKDDTSA